jgi:hypothetical protein
MTGSFSYEVSGLLQFGPEQVSASGGSGALALHIVQCCGRRCCRLRLLRLFLTNHFFDESDFKGVAVRVSMTLETVVRGSGRCTAKKERGSC